ncbi:MAG: hypothetical protein ACI9KE_003792 [Polyangiales bacterium]|jgi:hypothetical protein
MAETANKSDEKPLTRRRAAILRAGRLGRRIALGVYWVGLLYVLVVGFATVLPRVFFPATTVADPGGACLDELSTLQSSMLAEGERSIGRAEAADIQTFFDNWDATFVALYDRCSDVPAYVEVERLRYRYQATLRRFAREDRVLIDRAETALSHRNE